jgi:putative membrane protein
VNIAAMFFVVYVFPGNNGGVHATGSQAVIIAAVILGIVNAILRPILFVLSLPVVILTLGLFTLVINAITFWLVAHLGLGLSVDGFGAAFVAALVLSIVSFLLSHLVKEVEGPPAVRS